ncbi:hypothetical protein JTE90_017075 [Oedothorax gibbosus]|uniref:Uncharacterized protein n=1 Tax=Oedothorax gibbosus TaxID=931172 RepID=A0AAV6UL91_9ARAC|nr:hypothetical protein JTE90_017075 [Oedothorax gibbosus]
MTPSNCPQENPTHIVHCYPKTADTPQKMHVELPLNNKRELEKDDDGTHLNSGIEDQQAGGSHLELASYFERSTR